MIACKFAGINGQCHVSACKKQLILKDKTYIVGQQDLNEIVMPTAESLYTGVAGREVMELLEAALKDLMVAADDNGGCYGCMHLDADEKCTSEQGREMCDCKTNNMWRWKHADHYEALKAQFSETT